MTDETVQISTLETRTTRNDGVSAQLAQGNVEGTGARLTAT